MIGVFEPELKVIELSSSVGRWLKITKYVSHISEMGPIKRRSSSFLRSHLGDGSNPENDEGKSTNSFESVLKTTEEELFIGYLGSVSTREPASIQGVVEGSSFNAYALLGIWRYDRGITKCLFATEAEFVAEIGHGERIYKVNNVQFVPLIARGGEHPGDETQSDEFSEWEFRSKVESARLAEEMILSIFRRGGFYFSTSSNVDLTRSVRQSIKYGSKSGDLPEERFCWNYNLLMPLYEGGSTTSRWATPLLSGFVGFSRMHFQQPRSDDDEGDPVAIDFLLISRRDCRRQGVRYLCRGANLEGNVSNSVETEQIVLVRRPESISVYSYLQYRGSIPIIWRQPPNLKKSPPMEIYGGERYQQIVLNRHFNELSRKYCSQSGDGDSGQELSDRESGEGKILVVNLIDHRRHELNLGLEFEKYLEKVDINDIYCNSDSMLKKDQSSGRPVHKDEESCRSSNIRFCWFDFHSECSKMRWSNLKYLVGRLSEIGLDDLGVTSLEIRLRDRVGGLSPIIGIVQGHFCSSDNEFKVVVNNVQNGVCRTNCIDCLDRTNVVQSVIGRRVLHHVLNQLLELGLVDFSISHVSEHGPAFEPIPGGSSNESSFREIWSDNADALSKLYSGTPAQKTDFTRYGRRTRKGVLQDSVYSVVRFLLNSLIDGYTQDAYYVFTNQCSSPNSDLGIKKNIHDLLLQNKNRHLSPPVVIALGQYLMLITFLLLFPVFQLLFAYSQTFFGNLACLLLDAAYAPSKLFFHYQDATGPSPGSHWGAIPAFADYLLHPHECSIHYISGGIASVLLVVFGFIQFLKYKGPKAATKPLLDETNSQIWKKRENK